MSRRSDEAGTFQLLAQLPNQIMALGKAEYQNAKREVGRQAKKLGIGAVALIVALFFLFFSLAAFVTAAIAGLAVVWPVWLSALVIALALLAVAALAVWFGVNRIKNGNPVPEETIGRIELDVQRLAERGENRS
ncbi:phage holin family protein [Leucobacter sp. M11]|uniref:phage holin family protein n=1 Tax=Leucobacter sp. M11 TaxID=2993565 RepID=UPI002D7F8B02|nr:phage holin family protein [Leucobacter sp. M11]MEB4615045.1 phage holin family protein [Leucobacter sp. M11]